MNGLSLASVRALLCITLVIVPLLILNSCAAGDASREANSTAASQQSSNYSTDELDSYGMWIDLPPYGPVWQPEVTADWRPFYYGHWDYTEPSWTWVSYEPFGWIVYHYGNWLYAPEYGWVWIPGDGSWSPAVVEWMSYDDLVCWAPLPPPGVVWPRPWERYENRIDVWNVVHARDFTRDNVGDYRLQPAFTRPQEERPQIVRRYPDRRMIEQQAGRQVPNVNIGRAPARVGGHQMHRMQLPPSDQQRVEQHKQQAEKNIKRSSGRHR